MSNNKGDDGVVNPGAAYVLGLAPAIFLAGVPVVNYITTPGGIMEKVINATITATTYVASAGTVSSIPADRMIPALSALYLFGTYSVGGASSAGAIAASSPEGRDNNEPRAQVSQLRGLPLRAHSAHDHLMEVFPSFALAAGLTMTLSPTNQHLINLLGLHVLAKLFLFWPSYIFNIGGTRTLGHLLATSSVLGVAWKLTMS